MKFSKECNKVVKILDQVGGKLFLKMDDNLPIDSLFNISRDDREVFLECPTLIGYPVNINISMSESRIDRIKDGILSQIDDLEPDNLDIQKSDERVVILFNQDLSVRDLKEIFPMIPDSSYLECPIIKVYEDGKQKSSAG